MYKINCGKVLRDTRYGSYYCVGANHNSYSNGNRYDNIVHHTCIANLPPGICLFSPYIYIVHDRDWLRSNTTSGYRLHHDHTNLPMFILLMDVQIANVTSLDRSICNTHSVNCNVHTRLVAAAHCIMVIFCTKLYRQLLHSQQVPNITCVISYLFLDMTI